MDEHVEGEESSQSRLSIEGSDDDKPQPEVARIRRKVNLAGADGRVRSKTIAPKRLTREEKRLSETLIYPTDVIRPKIREECRTATRPCPFVSCSHHLYLDVNPESGAIKLNFPHLEVWEMDRDLFPGRGGPGRYHPGRSGRDLEPDPRAHPSGRGARADQDQAAHGRRSRPGLIVIEAGVRTLLSSMLTV
jgi:hypothetical protein